MTPCMTHTRFASQGFYTTLSLLISCLIETDGDVHLHAHWAGEKYPMHHKQFHICKEMVIGGDETDPVTPVKSRVLVQSYMICQAQHCTHPASDQTCGPAPV